MEQPKPEPETEHATQAPVQDPNQKPDPKEASHAPNGDGKWTSFVMESESQNETQNEPSPNRIASSGSRKSVHWSPELVTESSAMSSPHESNPYVSTARAPSSSFSLKDTVSTVRNVLGRWGKKVGEASKKAEDLAGNTWQHSCFYRSYKLFLKCFQNHFALFRNETVKTSPSFADAAMGRIAQGTKVLAEGGYDKIFRQTFETVPEEQLLDSYACYLSTSAGPVMGVLYVSTAKLAFSSDSPLSYKIDGQTEWSYYKVVIPLHQLKAVNPSTSGNNPAEKYIQVISVDDHEFWFMGFLNYGGAVRVIQEALQASSLQSA